MILYMPVLLRSRGRPNSRGSQPSRGQAGQGPGRAGAGLGQPGTPGARAGETNPDNPHLPVQFVR